MVSFPVKKSPKDWLSILGRHKFDVLRNKATEAPFSGDLNVEFRDGEYFCAGCEAKLFSSDDKFDAGCGWPSFTKSSRNVLFQEDKSLGMVRTEILCKHCGGHLGHWFPDGPANSRFCVNSLSLKFKKDHSP